MPDEEKLRRVNMARAGLKKHPHWNRITVELRQEQSQDRAIVTRPRELADKKAGQE
jgi:hypothetical protein